MELVMKNAKRRTDKGAATNDYTEQALVTKALEMFAAEGVSAVSLRRITVAAGAANQSAIHYHFKNRLGLVRAVLDKVNTSLAPLQSEALEELESINNDRTPTVREIVSIGLSPYIYLFNQSQEGRLSIRFLSRLTWESGEEAQTLMLNKVRPYFLKLLPYLEKALPDKPLDALDFQLYLAAANLIHGLSDMSLLSREPKSSADLLYRERPDDLLRYFYSYISGGLSSPIE